MNRICLTMIVKDEAHVIERCLKSVRPYLSHWVVVDTGSTDDTEERVRACLEGLPGELYRRPWRDFGTNRTEALRLARDRGDYLLTLDADEELVKEPGFVMPALDAGQYLLVHRRGDSRTSYQLPKLFRADLDFRYQGVLHEYLTCDQPHQRKFLVGLSVRGHFDGARNRDPVTKYRRDAEVLEAALEREPTNARYAFYLAQSYRDAELPEQAIEAYRRRAQMGGWDEETYAALYQVGELEQRLASDRGRVIEAYLTAYQFRPTRAEPLWALSVLCRRAGWWAPAALFAGQAVAISRPADILFVDDSVYEWRAADELAVATYHLGRYSESARLCRRLLDNPRLMPQDRGRIQQNLEFAERELKQADLSVRPAPGEEAEPLEERQ